MKNETQLKDVVIITHVTILLMIAVNVVVGYLDKPVSERIADLDAKWRDPYDFSAKVRTKEWLDLARTLDDYKALSNRDFNILHSEGGEPFPHPVLEYENLPTNNKFYQSSVEGARVNQKERTLNPSDLNGALWMFGGSTMWGWLNANENTIAAKLQYLAPKGYPLPVNLGVNGGDLGYVTKKLDLLLKKGYRPKEVLVLIGLNEMFKAVSPFPEWEIPTRASFFTATLVPENNELDSVSSSWSTFATLGQSLPVSSYVKNYRMEQRIRAVVEKEPICHFDEKNYEVGYRKLKINLCERWKIGVAASFIHEQTARLIKYYKLNLGYIGELGRRYGFVTTFLYQPIGYLDKQNIFLNPSYSGNVIKVAAMLEKKILVDTGLAQMGLRDGRHCVATDAKQRYTDAGHYSSATNEVIARCILETRKRDQR